MRIRISVFMYELIMDMYIYVFICLFIDMLVKIPFQTLEGATACARDTLKCGVTVGTYYFLSLFVPLSSLFLSSPHLISSLRCFLLGDVNF